MNYIYKKGFWETKDHNIIKIKDMETNHIENTIKFLQRTPTLYDEEYTGGWDSDSYYYDYIDNSNLVEEKIKELEAELRLRKIENRIAKMELTNNCDIILDKLEKYCYNRKSDLLLIKAYDKLMQDYCNIKISAFEEIIKEIKELKGVINSDE